ncbi:EKC/KEOPS complex subunit LAGE3-like [Suricata suricatta]|uniref:L antigen family member 3 n=1 Tax=Suricata suricatta TaxID=37032 RepID=A0A673VI22_SURSU|nr:EKC/KEOPS complex subunit LAGE3-like [Suricata suricatta]
MQAPDDGDDDSKAVSQAPNEDGSVVIKQTPIDDGAEGGTEGQGPQPLPRVPGCQGNLSGRDGDCGSDHKGGVDEGAGAPPQARRQPRAMGPGGDAAPAAMTSSQPLEFVLSVPFQSPLEAEMARRSLSTHIQRLPGVAQKELSVRGSTLAVRWIANDTVSFRFSANSFLDQISMVIRNVRGLQARPLRIWERARGANLMALTGQGSGG